MIGTSDGSFRLQARTEKAVNSDGTTNEATVFTAIGVQGQGSGRDTHRVFVGMNAERSGKCTVVKK